jgi:hypothetical protein
MKHLEGMPVNRVAKLFYAKKSEGRKKMPVTSDKNMKGTVLILCNWMNSRV